jgi:outer membrane protein assembly factor BamB
MNTDDMLFVGIKGRILALDRNTGKIIWETTLKWASLGDFFVNVFFDRGNVLAHTGGTLFCLDAVSGRIRWENPLTGYGYGIATLASVTGSSANPAGIVYKKSQDAAAAAS